MGSRGRELRELQVSPWRVLDGLRVAADAGGMHDLATYLGRHWRDLVPVIEDIMEADGLNIGVTSCGTGRLSVLERMEIRPNTSTVLPLKKYEKVIIGMSGGKDSIASLLLLMQRCRDQGIEPADKIELWHQLVDGHPDNLLATLEQGGAVYIGAKPLTRLQEHHIRLMRETVTVEAAQKLAVASLRPITAELSALEARRAREVEAYDAGRLAKRDVTTKVSIFRRRKQLRAREHELEAQRLTTQLKHLTGQLWQMHLDLDSEADVAPMLVPDRALSGWKRATEDALAPVLSQTANVFDWPCSTAYCIALAEHFGLPIRFQWRAGGILGGILRTNAPPGARYVEMGDYGTDAGAELASPPVNVNALGTRQMFPQVSSDLTVRWCSSYVKIEVGDAGITADPRFDDANVLLITGERRDEGGNRRKYPTVEEQATTTQTRRVDHYRPVLDCTEAQVWEVLRTYGIVPHPCYHLGFSRCSCATCIFLTKDEWSTIADVMPLQFEAIARLEELTGKTISRKGGTVRDQARDYRSFAPAGSAWRQIAMNAGPYTAPIYVDPSEWVYPRGAFQHGHGPN